MGEIGNDVLLWSRANYAAFGIRLAEPGDFSETDLTRFCPEHSAYGSVPTLVWAKRSAATWAREMYPLGLDGVLHYRSIDIDGDGQMDLLRAHSDGQDSGGWAHAQVAFTRRLAANEVFSSSGTPTGEHGPALLPYRIHGGEEAEVSSASSHAYFQAEGDINGDGIPDVLTSMTGASPAQIRLGDGRGGFGCDTVHDVTCVIPGNGTWLGPAYQPFFPDAEQPWPLQSDHPFHFAWASTSHRVHFLHDVTGDGYADLIGFTPAVSGQPGRIQLWINVDGRTFRCATTTDCVVGTISGPEQPAAEDVEPYRHTAHRIVITDFDGNGSQDFVLISDQGIWTFPFLTTPSASSYARAPQPGLLTRIDNGVGAITEVTYETIQELDRRASLLESSFKRGWNTHVPSVLPVVTSITTRDATAASGGASVAPFSFWRSRHFEYHDPAYDPWERRFKGFAIVRELDGSSAEVVQRWFYFGPCERSAFIDLLCRQGSDGGYERAPNGDWQVIDAQKELSGLQVRVDRFALGVAGQTAEKWLSTTTTQYKRNTEWIKSAVDVRGNRDRPVAIAQVARVDTHLYDTALEVTTVETINPPGVLQRAPEQSGAKRLRVDTSYDLQGNVESTVSFGRVTGSDGETPADDKIETRMLPSGRCQTNWACRATRVEIDDEPLGGAPFGPKRALRRTTFGYNTSSDLVWTDGELFTIGENAENKLIRPDPPFGAPVPSTAFAAAGGQNAPTTMRMRELDVDTFGNVTRIRGADAPNRSCTTIDYDSQFKQFPSSASSFAGANCSGRRLTTEHVHDRGLAAPLATLYPAGTIETIDYDTFGRAAKLYAPLSIGGIGTELSVEIDHYTQAPLPYVRIRRHTGAPDIHESYEIMNSLGEHVLGFDQADPSVDGATAQWVARDWTARDNEGRPAVGYRPFFTDADPLAVVTTTTSAPATSGNMLLTRYDEFGRAYEQDDGATTVARIAHLPLETRVQDAEQLDPGSPFAGIESSQQLDGHGRVVHVTEPGSDDDHVLTSDATYLGTGEVAEIVRSAASTVPTSRWVTWDSFGRMTENHEPNTGGTGVGWRYVYDAEGRLVGTSDARGCGKNLVYDALGRLRAEDYSPCLAPPLQPAHSAPNLTTGDGTEAFYTYDTYESGQVEPTAEFDDRPELALGQLVSIRDRGAHTRLSYDDRGRVRRVGRRIVKPGEPSETLSARYDARWFKQESTFDQADRLTKRTTGLDQAPLLGVGGSFETIAYSLRGVPKEIGSSYGMLVSNMRSTATGLPRYAKYGDAALTELERDYDDRERPLWMRATRAAAPAVWSTDTVDYPMPNEDTTQLELAVLDFTHDKVGNPLTITDSSTSTWRDGAKQLSRAYAYDRAYRVKEVNYTHAADPHLSPFRAERQAGDRRPIADRQGGDRITQETFAYDAYGNVHQNDDNEHLGFDRSVGNIWNGYTSTQNPAGGPHQFMESVSTSGDTWTSAAYDQAGNLTMLTVNRATCDFAAPDCTHRFLYDWDEVGQLVHARRWDFPAGEAPAFDPLAIPAWDLSYAHSQSGRTLTSKVGALEGPRHTLDVFDSLRVANVVFDEPSSAYDVNDYNEVGFLAGGAARIFFDREEVMPTAGPTRLHVFLTVGDALGSTSFVIDKDSGEVVERTQHQAFGKVESDYRPARWAANREEFKFTGKEEDIEVGATYFGARFYNAHIGRWMSADPLTVHGFAADANPYAYVRGHVSSKIDPFGLAECTGTGPGCPAAPTDPPTRPAPAAGTKAAAQPEKRHYPNAHRAAQSKPEGARAARPEFWIATPSHEVLARDDLGRLGTRPAVEELPAGDDPAYDTALATAHPALAPTIAAKHSEDLRIGFAQLVMMVLPTRLLPVRPGAGTTPLIAAEAGAGSSARAIPGLADLPADVAVPINAADPIPIPRALKPTEMAALTNTTGNIEFSQTFANGQYWLTRASFATPNRVQVLPLGPDTSWISHTHPVGYSGLPSPEDQRILQVLGQGASRVVRPNGSSVRFGP